MELSGLATSVTKIEEIGPKVAKPRTKRNKSKRHKECKNMLKSIVVTSSTTKDIPNLAALKQNMKALAVVWFSVTTRIPTLQLPRSAEKVPALHFLKSKLTAPVVPSFARSSRSPVNSHDKPTPRPPTKRNFATGGSCPDGCCPALMERR